MRIRSFFAALSAAAAFLCLPAQATLSSTASTVSYSGNGATTSFTVPYRFLLSSDLVVTTTDSGGIVTTKALGTDYTVTGAGTQSGTLTFTVAPASGLTIAINRVVDLKQLLSIRGARLLDQASLENELDKLAMGEQQLQAGVGAIGGDISGASVKITGTTTAVNIGDLLSVLPIPAKAFGVKCDGSDEHLTIQACVTAAVQCVLPPSQSCSLGASGLTVPTGHRPIGHGANSTVLSSSIAGCVTTFDGNDSGGAEKMRIHGTSTSASMHPMCWTNVTGPTLRMSFNDVTLVGAQSPPIAGAHCLYVRASTLNSLYYNYAPHLVTINCDRGIELLGDTGQGGANANWFPGYSSNGNVVGIDFDGKASDNYVQGHCNAGGTTFAQTCAIIGDGAVGNGAAGNELHVASDQGAGADKVAVVLNNNSTGNFVFSDEESGGTSSQLSDSTNIWISNKGINPTGRNALFPSGFFSSSNSLAGVTFLGATVRDTAQSHNVDANATLSTTTSFFVGHSGNTVAHTDQLLAVSGQLLFFYDEDASMSGVKTLTLTAPAGGTVNGSASKVVINAQSGSALCYASSTDGKTWLCITH